ncbi:MAG: hypothetical protein NDI61_08805, partial [Bdellovibrionaceae bacterium]|nr:hypothetical protein [Pseudobdellovibrionaceae bacterium]
LLMSRTVADLDVMSYDASTGLYRNVSKANSNLRYDQEMHQFALMPDGRLVTEVGSRLHFIPPGSINMSSVKSVPLNGPRAGRLRVLPNGTVVVIAQNLSALMFFKEGHGGAADYLSRWVNAPRSVLGFAALQGGDFLTSDDLGDIYRWVPDVSTPSYRPIDQPIETSHTEGITTLLQLRSGRILSASYDGTVKSYEATAAGDLKEVHSVDLSNGFIFKIAELPDGRVVVPSTGGLIHLLSVSESGELTSTESFSHEHEDLGMGMAVLRNGDFITSNSVYQDLSKVKKVQRWHSDVIEREIQIEAEGD